MPRTGGDAAAAAAGAGAEPARSAAADAAATVELACGACAPPAGAADGLRCRVGARGAASDVPGAWDGERGALVCKVPKSAAVGPVGYEVVDAQGNVVCRSSAGALGAGGAAARECEPACLQGGAPLPPAAGAAAGAVLAGLGWLDRLLAVWIIAAMVLGVVVGHFAPQVASGLAVADVGGVSLPIAVGLWAMMLPVLTKVRYELLAVLLRRRGVAGQFALSFALNWVVGPALMTGLAWACLPEPHLAGFRSGVIMVGLARCIAMVLIWNALAGGDAELCAVMVALNSVLQVLLYAPLSVFYLQVVSGVPAASVGFWPVAKSVLLFLGVPLLAGVLLRYGLIAAKSRRWLDESFLPWFGPVALLGLIYTVFVMFACQGSAIVGQVGSVARVAVPMLIYFLLMFSSSLALSWATGAAYGWAAAQAFTAASNNFELAISVAVGVWGVRSQEALAATVGPLIEVPVLLALVHAAVWLRSRVQWGVTRGCGAAARDCGAAARDCGAAARDCGAAPRDCGAAPRG
ncbi:acr3 [Scenedesmus sp. PABB004]|nr:acr3 [Scenedesmus sp. PABB004]